MATHLHSTPSGVNEPGLPAIRTRRGFLSAAICFPMVASIPLASVTAIAEKADAEVAELARLYDAAMGREREATTASEEAWERYVRPDIPEALFEQVDDPLSRIFDARNFGDGRRWFGNPDRIELLRKWPEQAMGTPWYAPILARRTEVLEACDRWEAADREARDRSGVTATDAEEEAIWEGEVKPLRIRILALRSMSPAAMALRVRTYIDTMAANDWRTCLDEQISDEVDREGGPWEGAFAASILRDVVLASVGAAA